MNLNRTVDLLRARNSAVWSRSSDAPAPVSRPNVLLRLRCKVMGHGPFLGGWLEITCLKCGHTWRAK